MDSLRDALLSSIKPDVLIRVNDIDGNKKKFGKLFDELKKTLSAKYTIYADTVKAEIYIQYK